MMIYYAFLLFFVLEYVRPGNYIPGLDILHLNSLIPLTVVAGTMFGKTRVSNQDFFADPNAKIILGLYSLIVLSVATATVTMHAYKVMNDVLGYVIIFWIIVAWLFIYMRLIGRLAWWIADVTPAPAEASKE